MHIELTRADGKGKVLYPIAYLIVFTALYQSKVTCYVRVVGYNAEEVRSLPVKETYAEIKEKLRKATGVIE
jgi:hypothetical protein